MSARFRGRRLPGAIGGLRGRCIIAPCDCDLACLAGHPTNRRGDFLAFGFGLGDYLDVRPSTIPSAGMGLFAKKEFEAGEVITIYDGHVSSKVFAPRNVCECTGAFFSHLHSIPGTKYVVWGFMYPVHGRGFGSFCNHSLVPAAKVTRRPLQFPYIGIHDCPDLQSHLVIKALRHIHVDEEITIKYPPHTRTRLGILN